MEITTFPAIISCPGKYIITEDLIFSSTSNTIQNLITVNACNVTIDLMGHTLSISDDYRYKNRWFNLIYSKHSVIVMNGTLGTTSGYSIKSNGNVHCNNITFSQYELGAVVSDTYISLNECNILSPNTTNTLYAYDYSRRMITVSFDLISNHSNALPIITIGQLTQYMATLENLLNFVLEQYRNGIYDVRFFKQDVSYRTNRVLHAPKIKLCNANISIPSINRYIYEMERLTNISTNTVILDVGYFPVQYTTSVTIPELSNVVWYSGYLVNTYNLPYYRMPQDIIDGIKNLQSSIPSGYFNDVILTPIIIIDANDIKLYDSNITISPDDIVTVIINNSRYVRCVNCKIGGIFRIISSKSVRISSSTLLELDIHVAQTLELTNNIITFLSLHNVGTNIIINNSSICNSIK